jgi:nicotinate dehydrogenase subunit B
MKRRKFLQASGVLTVAFNWWGSRAFVLGPGWENVDLNGSPLASALDSWLTIGRNGSVTVYTSKVDLGTGVLTALSQVMAEELDVSFRRIHMITGDTDRTIDQSQTSGSRTLHKAGPQLRQVAAAARHELLRRASLQLNLPVESLTVEDGVISAPKSASNSVSYWHLIGDQCFHLGVTAVGNGADLEVAPEIPAKNPKEYKIVGKSIPRVDLPAKFSGEFVYTQDVRVKGMLHGRVIRPNDVLSHPEFVDEKSVADVPGIVAVVKEGSFVGVVAETEWSAIQAAAKLKITWSKSAAHLPASPDELYAHLRDTASFAEQVVADKTASQNDPSLASRLKTVEATYQWPFQMHGMIGPSCAVAEVRGDGARIWTGSQGTHRTRKAVADLLGFAERDVQIIYAEGSGCYGRLCPDDVAEDAAVLSRAVRKPVRVQWMRQDEHVWEPKGSAQLIQVQASLNDNGNVESWNLTDRYFPYTAGADTRLLASRQIGMPQTGQGNTGHGFTYGKAGGGDLYVFSNQRIVSPVVPWIQNDLTPLRTCNLRAPGTVARTFASECFIDELASIAKIDPVEYRLALPVNDERTKEALNAAAAKAQWKSRPSPSKQSNDASATGRGVACANRDGTVVTAIAEIAVDKQSGKISVRRITIAQNCGMIANPDGVRNQIEGNVLQGVSRTLFEEVEFDERSVKNSTWTSYKTLRFEDIPEVDIVLLDRPELGFLGVGEAAIIPVPAAIANAVFDAIQVRLRTAPLTPLRVKAEFLATRLAHDRR